tara:strand:+ start:513 stop:974 length:462 start_codon:yes stop_codon:yes gene_type:complete
MILEAAKANLAPYLVPIIGTLVVVVLGAFWWLWSDREQLLEKNATQAVIISNAAQANRENVASIKYLEKDIAWREQKAIERQRRGRLRDEQLAQTREELIKALEDAPECVDQPWPDAVFNIMRRDTVLDPNRDRAGEGAGGVPGSDSDSRTGG